MEMYTFSVAFDAGKNLSKEFTQLLRAGGVEFNLQEKDDEFLDYVAEGEDYLVTLRFSIFEAEIDQIIGVVEASFLSGPEVIKILEKVIFHFLERSRGMDIGGRGFIISVSRETPEVHEKVRKCLNDAFSDFKLKVTEKKIKCFPNDTSRELERVSGKGPELS